MEELCDLFDNFTPLHDPEEASLELQFSSSISITELANSQFLMDSFNRYTKYIKYINNYFLEYEDGVILCLIDNFFNCRYKVSNIILAIKCVEIDRNILRMLENCSFV